MAARARRMPAIQENSLTPTRLSQSKGGRGGLGGGATRGGGAGRGGRGGEDANVPVLASRGGGGWERGEASRGVAATSSERPPPSLPPDPTAALPGGRDPPPAPSEPKLAPIALEGTAQSCHDAARGGCRDHPGRGLHPGQRAVAPRSRNQGENRRVPRMDATEPAVRDRSERA